MSIHLKPQTQARHSPIMASAAKGMGILQRKCVSCGNHVIVGDGCAECGRRKNGLQRKLAIGASNDTLEQEADRVAEQVLTTPIYPKINNGRLRIQRYTKQVTGDVDATPPASVDRVLASSGRPLESTLRQDMEQRFGYDFSRVRVHSSADAEQSAKDVNANAYTAGHNIVFGAAQFAPETHRGRRLLAHELTHVVQQSGSERNRFAQNDEKCYPSPVSRMVLSEHSAERNSTQVAPSATSRVEGQARVGAMQKKDDKALDEKAKKIIDAAKGTSKGIDQRAIDAVNSIVRTYYDPTLVEKVEYDKNDPGLTTSPIGTGKETKGKIIVGKYFIEHIDSFAHRVLQVGHELQHVRQQRSGMGGPAKKNEREFLAFHWEATQPEKAATGKMPHSSRVSLIDGALMNYYCMPDADQKTHADKKQELLKLRETEKRASGKDGKDLPTRCEKTTQGQPASPSDEPQKKPSERMVEGVASVVVETETKRDENKTQTGVAGKLSFEVTIPFTDKLKLGPVAFLKEAGVEASLSLKSGVSGLLTSSELETTVKVISLEFPKVVSSLGLADFGISGSAMAGEESKGALKFGLAGEAEAKFKRSEKSPFFITIKGSVEKTYDKEGNADIKLSPLTGKTSLSMGVEF